MQPESFSRVCCAESETVMYPLGAEYADVLCPDCRRVMVELARYAPVAGADSAPMDDALPMPSLRGDSGGLWEVFSIFGLLAGVLTSLFTGGFRRRKVQRLCQTLLPEYPKTLICPAAFSSLGESECDHPP